MSHTLTNDLLFALIESESLRIKELMTRWQRRKYAIFTAGPTARMFYSTLLDKYGIESEFFIDNNQSLVGMRIYDKEIKFEPWKTMPDFADNYVVIVATSHKYYKQISAQLSAAGITAHISWYTFLCSRLVSHYGRVVRLLDDEFSQYSYLAAIYAMLSASDRFVRYGGDHYFAHERFVKPIGQIVVDAGAFVGDSMEEYVRRSLGSVRVYSFEPSQSTAHAIKIRAERLRREWDIPDDALMIVPALLGETSGDGIYSLDDYFKDKQLPTIIKADIEGAEIAMLRGAEGILRATRPKLAISIYHSPLDMIEIAEFVQKFGYKLAVRSHSCDFDDTVLYCWTDDN